MRLNSPIESFVTGKEYERYVPADISLSSKNQNWEGLLFTQYTFPRHIDSNPRPGTTDHILGYLESGAQKGEYCYGGDGWRKFSSSKGDWIIQQAFENDHVDFKWDAVCDLEENLASCLVHISPEVLRQAASQVCGRDCESVELPHQISFRDETMVEIVNALKVEAQRGNPFGRLYIETIKGFLAVHLLQHHCSEKFSLSNYRNSLPASRLGRVVEYIHANLEQDIRLDDLASIAHLSTFHFARVFKKSTGMSPHHYLMQCRMQQARQLLVSTDWSITRISIETGYHSAGSFATMFKQLTGVGPSSYRRKN